MTTNDNTTARQAGLTATRTINRVRPDGKWIKFWFHEGPIGTPKVSAYHESEKLGNAYQLAEQADFDRLLAHGMVGFITHWEYQAPNWHLVRMEPPAAHSADARNGEGVAIPDGWKLVPLELTDSMEGALADAEVSDGTAASMWKAAVLAAPDAVGVQDVEVLEQCAQWCEAQAKSDWYGKSAADMVRAFALLAAPAAPAPKGWDKIEPVVEMDERTAFEEWVDSPKHGGKSRLDDFMAGVRFARKSATTADAAREADKIDYSLTRGDTVYSPYWGDGTRPVEVVYVNWALRAAAVRLSDKGGVVVSPVSHLQRERQQWAQSNG